MGYDERPIVNHYDCFNCNCDFANFIWITKKRNCANARRRFKRIRKNECTYGHRTRCLWTVETQIQNDTNDDITIDSFLFIVYDSERNEIFRTPLDLGTVLHAGEEKQISVTTLTNLETVTSCRYEIEGGVAK